MEIKPVKKKIWGKNYLLFWELGTVWSIPLGSACWVSAGSQNKWWLGEECQHWPVTNGPQGGWGSTTDLSERCQPKKLKIRSVEKSGWSRSLRDLNTILLSYPYRTSAYLLNQFQNGTYPLKTNTEWSRLCPTRFNVILSNEINNADGKKLVKILYAVQFG